MRLEVGPGEQGMRLDQWLARRQPALSRSRLQALIRSGRVTIGGRRVKPHAQTAPGMAVELEVPPPEPVCLAPEAIPLDVLYEDEELIVINKPAGLVVHPAAGHGSGTLVNALLHRCPDLPGIGGERRPGIVHRLDKDTSGVLVAAKTEAAMRGLVRQFQAGSVGKEYAALVMGVPEPPTGRVETLIGRSRHDRKKMSARPARGRPAATRYEVAERFGACSLLRVVIETGRTHQIRVHMAHLGHPVVGDRQYGGRRAAGASAVTLPAGIGRQMLHACELSFNHPSSGKRLTFRAPWPPDFERAVAALRAGC